MNQGYVSPQPTQQAYVPQQYQKAPSKSYVWIIMIGIIILMLGSVIAISAGFLENPESSDFKSEDYGSSSEANEAYKEAAEAYEDNLRLIPTLGSLFQYIGLTLIIIGLVDGALKDNSLPPNAKLGMLLAMGIIIGFKISTVITTSGYYGY